MDRCWLWNRWLVNCVFAVVANVWIQSVWYVCEKCYSWREVVACCGVGWSCGVRLRKDDVVVETVGASALVWNTRLLCVDMLVGVMVGAWVLDIVKDVFVEGFFMGWSVASLSVGRVTDFLASYYHPFFVGD